MTSFRSALARGGGLALAAAGAVVLAYQVQLPIDVPATGWLSAATFEDFYPAEGGFRWSRGRGRIVIPDPGPGVTGVVEADVVGWRPRPQAPPLVVMEAEGARTESRPSREGQTLALPVVTRGAWRSDLEIVLKSETFRPGPQDPRSLGVRVRGVRFVPEGSVVRPRRPPLAAPLVAGAVVLLLFASLVRLGARAEHARWLGWGVVAAAGVGYAIARPVAAGLSTPMLVASAALALVVLVAPAAARAVSTAAGASLRAWARGARATLAWPMLVTLAAGAAAMVAADRGHPVLDLDVGSGRESAVARNFGAFDAAGGATFRQALRGAALDLRDFGAGDWTVAVTAALGEAPRALPVVRVGGAEAEATLGEGWSATVVRARASGWWRSGLAVEFPAARDGLDLRIDRVRVDRARSWPAPRTVTLLLGAALFVAAAWGAAGLPPGAGQAAAAVVLAAEAVAVALEPEVTVPFTATFCAAAALGSALAAVLAGAVQVARERGRSAMPPPVAVASATMAFLAFFAAAAFPLYRGGHFGFHTQIAEEIWQGRFLLYYLPYPGSMLSRQAQWGDIIVPHPALFHTLVAPLAGLPPPWFHLGVKVVLALWLAGIVVVASALATAARGAAAGAWAGALAAGLVPGFQMLGLGHLMTILGCFSMAAALGFLILGFGRLRERRVWLTAVALLALCFLSYTAGLLFASFALAVALPLAWRAQPADARALAAVGLAAAAVAFLLYYVNWTWPFLSQSVPRMLHGSGAPDSGGTPVLKRLLALPHKLDYSYGSVLIPVLGLAGLARARAMRGWPLLLGWAAVLPVFCAADLFFNLLLKHHYFTVVPVAVGGGLGLAGLAERGPAGRVSAGVLLGLALLLGLQTALDAALGRIP
jgi:hypothetical protein